MSNQEKFKIMMNKKYIARVVCIVVLGLSISKTIFSQNSNLLYYFENVPQTNYTNPAMMPRANGFVGFPGLSSVAVDFKSDISAKDLVQNKGGEWVSPLSAAFDYSKLYKSFGKEMSVNVGVGYAPIYFGFRTRKGYFTFSLQEKVNTKIAIPKDIFQLAENGFEDGDILDLSTMDSKAIAYHEISIGYAQKINDQLTVGVHVKPLIGIAASKMSFNKFAIKNNRTSYDISVNGDIYSSVPFLSMTSNEDGIVDSIKMQDDISNEDIINAATDFSNTGIAFDFGAVYDLNESFSFSAALNNLGYINWKSNLNSLSSDGSYTYTGPVVNVTDLDDMDDDWDEVIDSLKESVELTSGEKSFKTGLSPELMLGAEYHVNYVFDLGFLSKSTFAKYNFRQEFVFSGNLNLYKGFSANVAYNYEIKGSSDLGLGMAFRGGPFQFYYMINHIPYYFDKVIIDDESMTLPTKAEAVSVMFGVNFVFGKHGFKNEPMVGKSY